MIFFPFLILTAFISFSCFKVLSRTSRTMLHRNGCSGHPFFPLLGKCPTEMNTYAYQKTCTRMFITTLFTIGKNRKKPNVLQLYEVCYSRTMEYYNVLKNTGSSWESTGEKEQTTATHDKYWATDARHRREQSEWPSHKGQKQEKLTYSVRTQESDCAWGIVNRSQHEEGFWGGGNDHFWRRL